VGLECELQLKAKENIILTKSNDVQLRNETIERQKRLIKELEEQAEARIIDYERSLTAERNALQLKIDDLSLKISALEGDKVGLAQKNALL
jgi:calcineurin-like phosphoesterase